MRIRGLVAAHIIIDPREPGRDPFLDAIALSRTLSGNIGSVLYRALIKEMIGQLSDQGLAELEPWLRNFLIARFGQ